jgi:protein TonB
MKARPVKPARPGPARPRNRPRRVAGRAAAEKGGAAARSARSPREFHFTTLQLALGLSVVIHAGLLTVRFVDPESFNRAFKETPLEVILVNARAGERPDKAQAVAQAALAGGGDLAEGRATSPLPPSSFATIGDSAEDEQRKIGAMQAQQMLLLAQLKQQLAALPAPDPRSVGNPNDAAAREEKRRQLVTLLAQVERRIQEENARPKKRYLSPATREAAYAAYVDALRRRIEERGTRNFPQAGGKKLYGELTMMVTVNFDGSILSTEIIESSGDKTLDSRAQAIVRSIQNFGKFTDAMRRQTDQIALPSRFRFTHDGTLETRLPSGPP